MIFSTGLRNYLLSGGSMRGALNGGVIRIYSGAAPLAPDDAVPVAATLLATISDNSTGNGLTFEANAVAGRLQKTPGQVWAGSATASQLATWFRFSPLADDGSASTTSLRLQGTVGQVGEDLNMSNPLFASGATQTVDFFSIFQPE